MNRQWPTPAQRDRARISRADAARSEGIPDPAPLEDTRQAFELDLRGAGGRLLRIEPRLGYVAWRAVDAESGEALHSAALKQLLHWVADNLPRWLALRNYQ
jgi:hypothetical protein